jgi:hypothetical protein
MSPYRLIANKVLTGQACGLVRQVNPETTHMPHAHPPAPLPRLSPPQASRIGPVRPRGRLVTGDGAFWEVCDVSPSFFRLPDEI